LTFYNGFKGGSTTPVRKDSAGKAVYNVVIWLVSWPRY